MGEDERNWRIWVIIVVGLAVALAVGTKVGLPLYRRAKEKHALTLAKRFYQAGDYRNAVLCLKKALSINYTNLAALEMMAELSAIAQSPFELDYRQRVAELAPTTTNKLKLLSAAMRVEQAPFPISRQVVSELAAVAHTNTEFHFLAARLALQQHQFETAERHLETALALAPTNRLIQLNLATLRLQSTNPIVAGAARRQLRELVNDPDWGIQALRALIVDQLSRGPDQDTIRDAETLIHHPQADFGDWLQYATVLDRLDKPQADIVINDLKTRARTNILQLVQLASWLNSNSRASETLQWLDSLPSFLTDVVPVQMAEANACVEARDWSRLQKRLEAQNWAEYEYLRLTFLTRALREQRRLELSAPVWQRAVAEAARRPETLLALAQLVASWGWQIESEQLLLRVGRQYPQYRWVFGILQELYINRGDTQALNKLYQVWMELEPAAPILKNNFAATLLLLGRDLDRATMLAQEAYNAEPTNVIVASTLAFALTRRGEFSRALQLLNSFPEDQLRHPAVAGYYALALYAGGNTTRAKQFAQIALAQRLLPEERALFRQILGQEN